MEESKVKQALLKIAEGVTELAEAFDAEETSVISTSKLKADGKKKGKKASEDLEIDEEETEDEADEEADEETEDEADEEADEETEDEEESDDETVTELELKNLKGALKKYSEKHGKPKAVKILQKFAKSSNDVKRKDFAKLLKLLKV